MWEALAKGHGALLVGTDEVRIVVPSPYHALRAIILDPSSNRISTIAALVDTVAAESAVARRVVEDASGEMDLSCHGLAVRFRLTVMVRPPRQPVGDLPGHGIGVVAVADPHTLIDAERILMAIFPPPPSPVNLRGRIQPARVLELPGWQVWLAYREGVPAGAAYTYDDGSSVGVYQVGTLAEHRGYGVGRAIMTAILRAYPDAVVTLTATERGRALYERLGFEAASDAIWWWANPTGDDSGEGLR
jgi:GNAT superfamily N-acetyltransferase